MTPLRPVVLFAAAFAVLLSGGHGLAQSPKPACGPDHAIIYKRAANLLNKAEKKLNDKYTAEAKSLVKEANSLFSILVKECAPTQQERELTEKELQQEAINKKLSEDALAQAEQLMKSAEDKEKKSQQAEAKGQTDLSISYQRQAKSEYERAHALSVKAEIYALRNQEMIFRFLNK
jgi:endo-alpha-1,4-polygalactosaminidase (GH114 family)|uniref:DUF4398 domain-containing protein n=1 Tax=Desulfobacca acetoxidans TaxID=60893 RepID=A0A7C3SIZ7_9BACT